MSNMVIRGSWRRLIPVCLLAGLGLLVSCKDDPTEPPPGQVLTGTLVSASDCKDLAAKNAGGAQDCLEYEYDGAGHLLLRHVNTAFNCCPEYSAELRVEDGVIRLVENEISGICDCLCLYDLAFEVTGLPPRWYRLVVEQEYVAPEDQVHDLLVPLLEATSGSSCLLRTAYPWN